MKNLHCNSAEKQGGIHANLEVQFIKISEQHEDVLLGPPNGGKCPNCKDGMLSFDRYGPRGEEYYSCVKCNFVVKK